MYTKDSKKFKTFLMTLIVIFCAFIPSEIKAQSNKIPLTNETALAISQGRIRFESGVFDNTLYRASVLRIDGDEDNDGLLNKDEIYTYEKNGRTFYGYNSHPYLEDTDGDGYTDKQEKLKTAGTNPLMWDISPRDMALFMELVYRDDAYITQVLDETQASVTNYKDRLEYSLMHKELAPFWKVKETYHNSNGFDAVLFENESKFPFIINNKVQVLGVRGTSEADDYDDDFAIAFSTVPKQVDVIDSILKNYKDRNDNNENYVSNLYITGHSLGGYLSQWGAITSRREGYNFFRKNYTFNAPKIQGNAFVSWVNERARVGDNLTDLGIANHYKTENDRLITEGKRFYGAKSIGNSSNGHGSRSYFESRMNNIHRTQQVYGFNFGKRNKIDGTGYIDPMFNRIYIYENGSPTINIQEGKKIFLWKNYDNVFEIPISDVERPSTIEAVELYGKPTDSNSTGVGDLTFEIDNTNSRFYLKGKANVSTGKYTRYIKVTDYPHTLMSRRVDVVVVNASSTTVNKVYKERVTENDILSSINIDYGTYTPLENERVTFRILEPIKEVYAEGIHNIPVEISNRDNFTRVINVKLNVRKLDSRKPTSIKQTYDEVSTHQKIEVLFTDDINATVTLLKRDDNNRVVEIMNASSPLTATKQGNKFVFNIDKNILEDSKTYLVKVEEVDRNIVTSDVSVVLDLLPPVTSFETLIKYKDSLYFEFESLENINVNNGLTLARLSNNRYRVNTSIDFETEGITVMDIYGNSKVIKPELEIRGNVEVVRPIRNDKKIIFKNFTDGLKVKIKISKSTNSIEEYEIVLGNNESEKHLDTPLKKGDVIQIKVYGNMPLKFTIR